MFDEAQLTGVKFLLFDAFGTLIAAEPDVATVYGQVAAGHGLELETAELTTRFRQALAHDAAHAPLQTSADGERQRWQRIVARVLHELAGSPAAFEQLWSHFAQPSAWRLRPGVTKTWRRLHAFKPGIASNFDHRLHNVCAGLPPLDSASRIFTSAEAGCAKPGAGFFRFVQQELNCQPHEILLVGDDPICDHQGARDAGWKWAAVQP